MKIAGKPCEGEPHARFESAGGGNGLPKGTTAPPLDHTASVVNKSPLKGDIMLKLSSISNAAQSYLQKGFTPDVLPGCANFVSHCMDAAGGSLGIISYVPNLVDKCEKVPPTKVETGMPVVFERTYDAVSPAGIGPEDDMTHIGILIIETDGLYFIDYGGSPAKVRKQKLEGWWLDRVQFCLKPPGFGSASANPSTTSNSSNSSEKPNSSEYRQVKLFYHPATPQVKIIIDGKEELVDEMMLSIRTNNNQELFVLNHKFDEYPYLNLDKERGKIKALEWHLKWEVG